MSYTHFTIEERERIQELRWAKWSMRRIARELGRTPSSISRELSRNLPPERKRYAPRLAHARALRQRRSRGRTERLKSAVLRTYTVTQLKRGWSPEQIAGTSLHAVGQTISHEAIYQYIYAQVHRAGYGYVKPGCEDLRAYLPRRRKRRMRKGMRSVQRIERTERLPSIDTRPNEVAERTRIGHWEDDLIVSRASSDNLKTINERVSGIVFIGRVKDGSAAETNRVVTERLGGVPAQWRRTLTRDRGTENMGYVALQDTLGLDCYFAHAYHSWERGSNENLNGLIRRFFPKGTDFRTITNEQIRQVEYLLNSRPRKRLGYKTPYQVFYEQTGVALTC